VTSPLFQFITHPEARNKSLKAVVPHHKTAPSFASGRRLVFIVAVVNVAVVGVVAPTVQLIFIEAVPVRFVTVHDVGVPSAPLNSTGAPAEPIFIPSAAWTPVPNVIAFCFPLKVDQSALDNAPRFAAEAVGKLNVCVLVAEDIAKSVPAVPTAKV
jgi:hypothetical protein